MIKKYRKWQQDWIESLGDYYKDDDQAFSQSDGSTVVMMGYAFGL